jgi:hypothetical protein
MHDVMADLAKSLFEVLDAPAELPPCRSQQIDLLKVP